MAANMASVLLVLALLAPAGGAALRGGAHRPRRYGHANLYQLALSLREREVQEAVARSGLVTETRSITQRLDHFDSAEERTFSQRYHKNLAYVPGGSVTADTPLFFYICGEAECGESSVLAGEVVERAQQHHGAIFALEHRYYGVSQPFDTLETENLRWLTSQQALADYVVFIEQMRVSPKNPIITVGGSYAGALSSWVRLKYPHITWGSIASSAPVRAKADFFEYDEVVAASAGPECADAIRAATSDVETQLFANPTQTKALFDCSAVDDDVDFLYVLADAVAFAVQYDSSTDKLRSRMCYNMTHTQSPVETYAVFVTTLFQELGTDCVHFSTVGTVLQNVTTAPDLNQRQWFYQSCNEFGFFQTAPHTEGARPLRSPLINLTYHLQLCERAFLQQVAPHIDFTNAYYGSDSPRGSNIYIPNGSLDPWHVLSITNPLPCCPSVEVEVIDGTAHCADLSKTLPTDPPSLTAARAHISVAVSRWLEAGGNPVNPSSSGGGGKPLGPLVALTVVFGVIAAVAVGGAWFYVRGQRRRADWSSGTAEETLI